MKVYHGNHVGLVINNNDPEYRGRVQVFVPHIMPALYKDWNEAGEDISISCVGDNIEDSLTSDIVDRLQKILPWAEAASPIIGSSSPGGLLQSVGSAIESAASAVKKYFVQTPTAEPTVSSSGNALADSALSLIGTSTGNIPGYNTDGGNLGCAAAVSIMFKNATGQDIIPGQTIVTGTNALYNHMSNSSDYVQVSLDKMEPGDILVTARGSKAGHTGIYVGDDKIVSNSSSGFQGSARGTIQQNYNTKSWERGVIARNPEQSAVFRYVGPSTQQKNIAQQTSSSALQAAPNPLATSEGPQGSQAQTAIEPNTSLEPLQAASGKATTTIGNSKLGSDRSARFGQELQDPAIINALWERANNEVGQNPAQQQAWIETVTNRAYFSNKSLRSVVQTEYVQGGYYPETSFKNFGPAPANFQTVVNNVFVNGSNLTNLATDNASNQRYSGGNVAQNRINNNVTGTWYENGQPVSAERAAQLASANPTPNGVQFLYRSDAGNYKTNAGLAAAKYATSNSITPDTDIPNLTAPPSVVNKTDGYGKTIVKNTNDMAKGLFAFPNVGAMVWVFFREGNPLYPVYFAASYSSSEWQSAYRGSSLNASGTNTGNPSKDEIANSTNLNFNSSGGIEATEVTNVADPTKSKKVLMIHGPDGSNRAFTPGYVQDYTRGSKRDQVDSNSFSIVGGYEEKWIEADSSCNIRGNNIVKVGKFDQEAIDAMKALSDFSNEINQMIKS